MPHLCTGVKGGNAAAGLSDGNTYVDCAKSHTGAQAGGGGRIVRPAGAGGPAYQTTENFKVILRWNQSDFFALAVGLLSDRIAA